MNRLKLFLGRLFHRHDWRRKVLFRECKTCPASEEWDRRWDAWRKVI